MKTNKEIIQLEVTFNKETRVMDFVVFDQVVDHITALSLSDVSFQIGHGEKRHASPLKAWKTNNVWKVSYRSCIRNKQAKACGFIDSVNDSMKTKQNYYGSFNK